MESINEIQVKLLLLITFFCMGLYRYIPGPTFIDLSARISEDLLTMPLFLTARATGYIVGCITGTFTFHKFLNTTQKPLLFFLMILLMAVTAYSMSICTTFVTLSITFCAAGVCLAAVDTGANAFYLHAFGELDYFYFQSLHLFYGIGVFTAPLIVRNYIREHVNVTNITSPMEPDETQGKFDASYYITSVSYPYVITSIALFVVSLLWFAKTCFQFSNIENIIVDAAEDLGSRYKTLVIFTSALLNFFISSLDFSYPQVLAVYCVVALHWTQKESTDVVILFLGCFVIARLISTVVAIKVSPHNMLSFAVVLIFCGSIFLFLNMNSIFYMNHSYFMVANSLLGLGAGPIYPALMDWLCNKMYISHRNVVPIFLMQSLSELVVPVLLSRYIWHLFFTISYFVLGVSIILFFLLLCQFVLFFGPNARSLYHPAHPLPVMASSSFIRRLTGKRLPLRRQELPYTGRVYVDRVLNVQAVLERLDKMRYRIDMQNRGITDTLRQLEFGNDAPNNICTDMRCTQRGITHTTTQCNRVTSTPSTNITTERRDISSGESSTSIKGPSSTTDI